MVAASFAHGGDIANTSFNCGVRNSPPSLSSPSHQYNACLCQVTNSCCLPAKGEPQRRVAAAAPSSRRSYLSCPYLLSPIGVRAGRKNDRRRRLRWRFVRRCCDAEGGFGDGTYHGALLVNQILAWWRTAVDTYAARRNVNISV